MHIETLATFDSPINANRKSITSTHLINICLDFKKPFSYAYIHRREIDMWAFILVPDAKINQEKEIVL